MELGVRGRIENCFPGGKAGWVPRHLLSTFGRAQPVPETSQEFLTEINLED